MNGPEQRPCQHCSADPYQAQSRSHPSLPITPMSTKRLPTLLLEKSTRKPPKSISPIEVSGAARLASVVPR